MSDQFALREYVQSDGSIQCRMGRKYMYWFPHPSRIVLDGEFTVGELRQLVAHMVAHGQEDHGDATP